MDMIYATRGSFGFSLKRGISSQSQDVILQKLLDPKNQICRALKFSNDGQYLGYCDSERTVLIETVSGNELFDAPLSKTSHILFSPQDSVMITYEPYVIYGTRMNDDGTVKKPNPNLRFWSVRERKLLTTTISEKQSAWRPQFTADESICLRLSGSEVLFYQNCQFDKFVKKVAIKSLDLFEVSKNFNSPHVLCFLPPLKGQPGLIQLRRLSMDSDLPVVSSKISFNADKCTFLWNDRGTAALATCTIDVDKSDKSYYGVSQIFVITLKDECVRIQPDKEGPIHDCKWSPSGKEFVLCYGFMPSKVAVFNVKGDIVWQHGEGHRNEVHYNPFGTILAICSFGNLSSGKMEFWNVETKELIDTFEVPSTTFFEWAPDGNHFCTATTAPRLRMSNGYRIWHYTAKCLLDVSYDKENEKKEELWQVCWRPSKSYAKTEIQMLTATQRNVIANNIITSNISKHPVDSLGAIGAITKKGAYVPPSMRKPGVDKPAKQVSIKPPLSENEKKIKNLEKKIEDITKLKEKRDQGVVLELNQLEKIDGEISLVRELKQLRLSVATST